MADGIIRGFSKEIPVYFNKKIRWQKDALGTTTRALDSALYLVMT